MLVTIMITERCNFRCGHCLLTCNGKGMDITPETLKNTQEILRHASGVNILGGEPFLNKQFDYIIQQLAFANIYQYVRIVSNGSWIYSPTKTEKIMETYKSILQNGKWEGVELCISNDVYHRQFWKNPDHMKIIDRTLDYEGLKDYDGFFFDKSERRPESIISLGRANNENMWCEMDSKSASCMDTIYDKKNDPESDIYPLDNIFIFPNGDYSPCCQGVAKIGNINRESFNTVEDKMKTFYNSLLTKELHFGDCKNCKKINSKVIKELTRE